MNDGFSGTFTVPQTKQLLAPIKPQRVLADPRGNSHVSQQDVTAHLIRVFGFGNFATELLALECIFEAMRPNATEQQNQRNAQRWDVAYRAHMRLTIFDRFHNVVTTYEDASVGDGQNLPRADCHDIAMKSAISLAKKRCCINLGDQFGLSLYNKGQLEALVGGTHVLPKDYDKPADGKDLQDDVPKQESMGVDEIEKVTDDTVDEAAEQRIQESLGGTRVDDMPEPAEEAKR